MEVPDKDLMPTFMSCYVDIGILNEVKESRYHWHRLCYNLLNAY